MGERPAVGAIGIVTMPGDVTRRFKILSVDDDMILVRWLDYSLPNEWIPTRWL
jgi:hypothetical protein